MSHQVVLLDNIHSTKIFTNGIISLYTSLISRLKNAVWWHKMRTFCKQRFCTGNESGNLMISRHLFTSGPVDYRRFDWRFFLHAIKFDYSPTIYFNNHDRTVLFIGVLNQYQKNWQIQAMDTKTCKFLQLGYVGFI